MRITHTYPRPSFNISSPAYSQISYAKRTNAGQVEAVLNEHIPKDVKVYFHSPYTCAFFGLSVNSLCRTPLIFMRVCHFPYTADGKVRFLVVGTEARRERREHGRVQERAVDIVPLHV